MDGFLFVNKPQGLTSHDVVYKLKKKLNVEKIGHTGTLDPFASGLLILCIGKATKLAHLFSNLDKIYTGTIVFGNHYDTYDVTGKIMASKSVEFDDSRLHEAIQSFIGTYEQVSTHVFCN
jgi:tRNA pseudouridine55 synthase